MRLTTLAALSLAAFSFCQPCLAAADPGCTAEIKAIMLASLNAGPVHLEAKVTSAATGEMLSTMDMVPPTALHSVSTANGTTTEMTFVDGRGFMNMSGTWTELPAEMAGTMTAIFAPETIDKSLASLEKAECAVAADWQGKPALRYTFSTNIEGTTSDITMWIDATSRLPIHNETVSTVAGQAMTSVSDYTYDPSITIKAPL